MLSNVACARGLVPAVRVVVVGEHPTRKHIIASFGSITNTLAVEDFEFIEDRLFHVPALCLPRYERDKL